MTEDIDKKVVDEAEVAAIAAAEAEAAKSSSQEIDYKALADAERERADAAEALIVKNKALAKRHKDDSEEEEVAEEDKPLTRKDLDEALKNLKPQGESEESKRLAAAQKTVTDLQNKNKEIARALQAKDSVSRDSTSSQRDGEKVAEPKLPENSPLKGYVHTGDGIYSKKLSSGKTMFKNTRAMGNERKTWIE